MDWLISLLLIVAALIVLPWWFATSSDPHRRGGGVAGDFIGGLADELDPRAALIREENEKRLELEGEEDAGGPKDPRRKPPQRL